MNGSIVHTWMVLAEAVIWSTVSSGVRCPSSTTTWSAVNAANALAVMSRNVYRGHHRQRIRGVHCGPCCGRTGTAHAARYGAPDNRFGQHHPGADDTSVHSGNVSVGGDEYYGNRAARSAFGQPPLEQLCPADSRSSQRSAGARLVELSGSERFAEQ